MTLKVQDASAGAIEAVERVGGRVELVYMSQREIQAVTKPESFVIAPSEKMHPTEWKGLRRYIDPEKRGYLSGEEDVASIVDRCLSRAKFEKS